MTKLIKIYKQNCNPCTMVSGFLDSNSVVYDEFDIMENTELAVKYGIMSVPVTILLDNDGNEIARSNGFNPPELERLISQL
ncbi:glutaredoxin family protein [Bacillus sp. FJAT-22090]|uniref:glutaredoxin family protein n=1 Tax=Bacillus sp. FJAT-22090 TaxID=1581038 RepID=UPI0011A7CA78|nr:glutaredoxin family protein [Bacillus sp. FJAT-22090]